MGGISCSLELVGTAGTTELLDIKNRLSELSGTLKGLRFGLGMPTLGRGAGAIFLYRDEDEEPGEPDEELVEALLCVRLEMEANLRPELESLLVGVLVVRFSSKQMLGALLSRRSDLITSVGVDSTVEEVSFPSSILLSEAESVVLVDSPTEELLFTASEGMTTSSSRDNLLLTPSTKLSPKLSVGGCLNSSGISDENKLFIAWEVELILL